MTDGESFLKRGFDFDGFWKELITRFFHELLLRAIPALHRDADAEAEPRFLEKEFTDILNTADREIRTSPHHADLVVEVPLRGKERAEYVLLHIESQQPGGGNLAERMNHYRSLIHAHYNREPVALAIVTGGRRGSERSYAHSRYGTEVCYKYNNLVLAELGDEELRSSDNPIDLALYAAKCASRAKEELQKLNYLRTLLDLLSERGWDRDDKRDLLLFLERIIDLRDRGLERQYVEYRNRMKREGKVMYIPLGEREVAEEIWRKGMEKGMEKGRAEMARNLLIRGDYAPEVISEITGLPLAQIRGLMN